MLKEIIYSTSLQKVLYFLLSHPDEKYFDREIARLSGMSKASTNFALRDLRKEGLVNREKKGRMYFYHVDATNPLIRQLKITQNLLIIQPLIERLKPVSLQIILYGSASKGVNHKDSDIDIFILTRESLKAKDIIYKSQLREKLQYEIRSPQEFIRLKKENTVFVKEISSGIVLYEEKQH